MSKALIFLFYGVATLAGMGGLLAGGIPLIAYAWARWQNPELGYYANLALVSSAENTLLVSFILLVAIHISYVVCRHTNNLSGSKPTAADPALPAGGAANAAAAARLEKDAATADDKLSRLLKPPAANPEK